MATGAIIRAFRSGDIVVTQNCPLRPYLELAVPTQVSSVDSITFTIISHDQGYCSDPNNTASYTWFDAGIALPPDSGRDRVFARVILRNVLADDQFREQVTEWQRSGPDSSTAEFVASIRGGDVIQVTPRASFPAWWNYVRSVRIEAYCQLATADPPVLGTGSPGTPQVDVSMSVPAAAPSLYEPLSVDAKEIRLLHLYPGEADEPLSCRLVTAALDDAKTTPFEALSYCWGTAADLKTITVHVGSEDLYTPQTRTLSVTASLDQALRYLRKGCKDRTPRVLWIDAVCIDQTNVEERGSQVGMMGEIFAKATATVIWLGAGMSDTHAHETVEMMEHVVQYLQYEPPTATSTGVLRYDYGGPDEGQEDFVTDKMFHLFAQFFAYPWFRRVWVVQEVWLSRNAVFNLGNETIPWKTVMLANYFMVNTRWGLAPGLVHEWLPSLWTRIAEHQNILTPSDAMGRETSRLKILDLVLEGAELGATDRRDRIFALLSLGEETHKRDSLPALLRPNYTKTASRVYVDFTLWWIDHYKSLAILSAVHASSGRTWQDLHCSSGTRAAPVATSDHPSWALPPTGKAQWAETTLGLYSEFSTAGDTTPVLGPCDDPSSQLALGGARIGTIAEIKHYPFLQRAWHANDDLHAAFLRVLDPSGSAGTWCRPHLVPGRRRTSRNYRDEGLEVRSAVDHIHAHEDEEAVFPCLSPCFLTTEDGMIGLCPAGSRVGDLIVVLYGGSVPYILREVEAAPGSSGENSDQTLYHFVGECYIQGKMSGSVVREQEESGSSLEMFTLV